MSSNIYKILTARKKDKVKSFAVLIDPDQLQETKDCVALIRLGKENKVDFFFLGGSLVTRYQFASIIALIKEHCDIPVILFPGNNLHIHPDADSILLLSLISGRNPDLLIGQHVVAAPILKKSNLEILPTGYMLIDSGRQTTASYMSNTTPIPADKSSVAVCTAMAGQMLGLKLIYMDAGSGANNVIPGKMISQVSSAIEVPLIIGGGIDSSSKALQVLKAGADVIVIGNGIEKNPRLLVEIAEKVRFFNKTTCASQY